MSEEEWKKAFKELQNATFSLVNKMIENKQKISDKVPPPCFGKEIDELEDVDLLGCKDCKVQYECFVERQRKQETEKNE